jgi:hypothetical protein
VFSTDDVNKLITDDELNEWRPEWHREPYRGEEKRISGPPQRLLRELSGRSALGECPSVLALLRAKGAGFGSDAVAAGMEFDLRSVPNSLNSEEPIHAYRASIERFTLPVISADGRQAVLAADSQSDPATGSGSFFYLRRSGGRGWKVYGSALFWRSG